MRTIQSEFDEALGKNIRILSVTEAETGGITCVEKNSATVEIGEKDEAFAIVATPRLRMDSAKITILRKQDSVALDPRSGKLVVERGHVTTLVAIDEADDAEIPKLDQPDSIKRLIEIARSCLSPIDRTTAIGTPQAFAAAYDILSTNMSPENDAETEINDYLFLCAWQLNERSSFAQAKKPQADPRTPLLRIAKPAFSEIHSSAFGFFRLVSRSIVDFIEPFPTMDHASAHERMAAIALLREVAELAKNDPLVNHLAWKAALGQT